MESYGYQNGASWLLVFGSLPFYYLRFTGSVTLRQYFNPIAILLLTSYGLLCEYVADDYAMEGCTVEQRRAYGKLLIDIAASKAVPVVWRSNFSNARFLRRRLIYIMNKQKISKINRVITAVVSLFAIVASSITVLAYEPLQSSNDEAITYLNENSFMDFVPYEENAEALDDVTDIDFSERDNVFISNSGQTIPLYLETGCNTQAICNHKFIDGTLYKHVGNNSGGCTIYVYTAQVCSKCNYLKAQTLIRTTTYVKCTHSN